jgi:hypothetical protein
VVYDFARFILNNVFKKRECLGSSLDRRFICDAAAIWSCAFSRFGVVHTSPVPRRWNGDVKDVTKSLAQLANAPPIYEQF